MQQWFSHKQANAYYLVKFTKETREVTVLLASSKYKHYFVTKQTSNSHNAVITNGGSRSKQEERKKLLTKLFAKNCCKLMLAQARASDSLIWS